MSAQKPNLTATFWDTEGGDRFVTAQYTGKGSVHVNTFDAYGTSVAVAPEDAVALGRILIAMGELGIEDNRERP